MTKSGIFKLVGLVALVLLAVAAYRLLGTAVEPKIEHRIGQIGLTSNEIAANGPLPGDVSQYAKELACAQNLPTPGYYHRSMARSSPMRSAAGCSLRHVQRQLRRTEPGFRVARRPWNMTQRRTSTTAAPASFTSRGVRRHPQGRDSGGALRRQGRRDHGP